MSKIKDFFGNPKKRGVARLTFYFIFFVFVFIILGSQNSKKISSNNDILKDNYTIDDYLSYNFNINYNYLDHTDNINGTYYKGKAIFNFLNSRYYYENDITYIIDNDLYYISDIQYNVSEIFKIGEIYNNLIFESKTEYKDGKIVNFYTFNPQSDKYSSLEETKIDKFITFIKLNLKDSNLISIEIEYSNINDVTFDFNKENYTYRE